MSRLVVRADRGSTYLLPWQPVGRIARHAPIRMRAGKTHAAHRGHMRDLPLDRDELLLARDVVDTQVVDLHEHRLSRVSDLILARRPDSGLEVAAADVGMGAVLRRIGLSWFARHLTPVVVDWHDLHLTSSRGTTSSSAPARRASAAWTAKDSPSS